MRTESARRESGETPDFVDEVGMVREAAPVGDGREVQRRAVAKQPRAGVEALEPACGLWRYAHTIVEELLQAAFSHAEPRREITNLDFTARRADAPDGFDDAGLRCQSSSPASVGRSVAEEPLEEQTLGYGSAVSTVRGLGKTLEGG